MAELERLALDDRDWRSFVGAHADATPFHDPAWARVIAECYGLDAFVLAERGPTGALVAGLPVVAAPRLPGRGRRLVSLPYTDLVCPLVEPAGEPHFARLLDDARRRLGFDRLELRAPLAGSSPLPETAVIHRLALPPQPESLLAGLSGKRRQRIRAAARSTVAIRRAEREEDVTETYFRLHLLTRRRLGVPSQPRRFFRLLWRHVLEPGGGFVLLAEAGGAPLAGAVFMTGNETVVYKYSATDRSIRAGEPAELLLWRALAESCEQGFSTFDFGRTELDAHGLRGFKARWGAVEEPLVYSVLGRHGAGGATGAPGAGLVKGALRRAPLWVTRLSGELLYRYAA